MTSLPQTPPVASEDRQFSRSLLLQSERTSLKNSNSHTAVARWSFLGDRTPARRRFHACSFGVSCRAAQARAFAAAALDMKFHKGSHS
jgi:hypothetical protein